MRYQEASRCQPTAAPSPPGSHQAETLDRSEPPRVTTVEHTEMRTRGDERDPGPDQTRSRSSTARWGAARTRSGVYQAGLTAEVIGHAVCGSMVDAMTPDGEGAALFDGRSLRPVRVGGRRTIGSCSPRPVAVARPGVASAPLAKQ